MLRYPLHFGCIGLLSLWLSLPAGATPPAQTPQTRHTHAREHAFLKAWLVRANLDEAKTFLDSDFRLPPEVEGGNWQQLALLSQQERALRFPFELCSTFPDPCDELGDCIRGAPPSQAIVSVDRKRVDKAAIASLPWIGKYRGQPMCIVTFILRGCGIGVGVVFAGKGEAMKVVTIMYMAG